MAVLESQLRITAVDETKGAFDAIEAHVKRLSQTVASVNKVVGQTGAAVAAVNRNAALASRGKGGIGSSIVGAAAGVGGTYLATRAGEAAVR